MSGGTPAYMAPEEASGATPSEASDWYGVGVTLYEALTGTLPVRRPVTDVLCPQANDRSAGPADVAPDVPADLSAICMGLLRRDPDAAPVRATPLFASWLATTAITGRRRPRRRPIRDAPFVGRDRQLHASERRPVEAVTNGNAAAVSVSRPVRHRQERAGPALSRPVRCARRCRRALRPLLRERVGAVQGARRRGRRPEPPSRLDFRTRSVERLLPPRRGGADARVPGAAAGATPSPHARRDQASRERRSSRAAAAGIRGACASCSAALADRRPLVICIDDLQWADADSVVLLEELLRPPGPPAMLTLLSFRSEETAAKPFLQALLDRAGRDSWSAMSLEPLTEDEAQALIGALLPADSSARPTTTGVA